MNSLPKDKTNTKKIIKDHIKWKPKESFLLISCQEDKVKTDLIAKLKISTNLSRRYKNTCKNTMWRWVPKKL